MEKYLFFEDTKNEDDDGKLGEQKLQLSSS